MNKTGIEWCDFSVNPIRARRILPDISPVGEKSALEIIWKSGHYCEKIAPECPLSLLVMKRSSARKRWNRKMWPEAKLIDENTPKDEDILAWWPGEKRWLLTQRFYERWTTRDFYTFRLDSSQPTHWLPLPPAPGPEVAK